MVRFTELLSPRVEFNGISIELIEFECGEFNGFCCDRNSAIVLLISSGTFVTENGDR